MTEKQDTERIAEARREGLAALAIVSDPNCLPRQAASHLVGAWEALRGPPNEDDDLPSWVRRDLASAKVERREPTVKFLESCADEAALQRLSEDEMRALIQTLLARVRTHERGEATKEAADKSTFALWGRRFGAWAGIVVVFALVALRPWTYQGVGQWHGAYYPGKDFRGEPDVRREADVDFSWGALPPTDSIPSDRFAARFTTCLHLDEGVEAAFQLIADDAARLIIDGEDVIDLWDVKEGEKGEKGEKIEMPRSFGREYELDAGVHSVVVEYREEDEAAEVHFLATFDQDVPPGPLPSSMLEYPGETFDEDNPCGIE
ncbi:MAG: PA14 domain-containing protein [Nannocystaceae bacterium]|nr:PA14 domain-containing protein [bacterium]